MPQNLNVMLRTWNFLNFPKLRSSEAKLEESVTIYMFSWKLAEKQRY